MFVSIFFLYRSALPRAQYKGAEPAESYAGKMPVAKSAVHLVSQMLKDACFSGYLLAFIPFSNDKPVLQLCFLYDPSNGILSGFHLEK